MKSNNGNKSPHKRGGQPGNTNALKHGFYSRRGSPVEHPLGIQSLYSLSPTDEYQLAIDEALTEIIDELNLSV